MKGFTLMEVLVSLVIISLLFLLTTPIIKNYSATIEKKLYAEQISNIKQAASDWAAKNLNVLPSNRDSITIYLGELKNSNLIDKNIKNPLTGELFYNDMEIVISNYDEEFVVTVKENSGSGELDYTELTPSIILNGGTEVITEYGYPYKDLGIFAYDRFGKRIKEFDTIYKSNGLEVSEIDTSRLLTYTVHYIINYQDIEVEAIRKVLVRDTLKPTISFPETTIVSTSLVASFDPLEELVVTDKSTYSVNVTSNLSATPGTYTINYIVIDASNNEASSSRTIIVQ